MNARTCSTYPFEGAMLLFLGVVWILSHCALVHGFAPAAFFAIAPLALGIIGAKGLREVAAFALLGGWAFFMAAEFFLAFFSWKGLIVLAFYQALTLVPVALAMRWMIYRWQIPLAFSLPIAWVGGEFLRNLGPFALPTGMLMGPCQEQITMIQVCDLAGVYGFNFALGMVNGCCAESALVLGRRKDITVLKRAWGITGLVWMCVLVYGQYRLDEAKRTMRPGPVVALVQPDVPYRAGINNGFDPGLYLEEMCAQSEAAMSERPRPEMIIWPESMSAMPAVNPELTEYRGELREGMAPRRSAGQGAATVLRKRVADWKTPLLLGTLAWIPGSASSVLWQCFNSASLLLPSGGEAEPRQFKQRLFPGGEHLPFSGTWIHRWLLSLLTPEGEPDPTLDLTAGEKRDVFQMAPSGPKYIMNICYEILFPDSSGAFLKGGNGAKPFDFLLNISNDGIFQRSAGQMVHWRVLPFRAVESRIGIARAANTGISGFVKPTGETYGEVRNARGEIRTGRGAPELALIGDIVKRRERETEILSNPAECQRLTQDIARVKSLRAEAGVSGHSVGQIYLDSRRTVYSRTGDIFAWSLLVSTVAAAICEIVGGLAISGCSARRRGLRSRDFGARSSVG